MQATQDVSDVLKGITEELRALVEINKVQTEKILENTRMMNSLFTRQMAMEKAVSAVLTPAQRSSFNAVFENNLQAG